MAMRQAEGSRRSCAGYDNDPKTWVNKRDAALFAQAERGCACCARAANGHATAALPRSVMNLRRLMCFPQTDGSRPTTSLASLVVLYSILAHPTSAMGHS